MRACQVGLCVEGCGGISRYEVRGYGGAGVRGYEVRGYRGAGVRGYENSSRYEVRGTRYEDSLTVRGLPPQILLAAPPKTSYKLFSYLVPRTSYLEPSSYLVPRTSYLEPSSYPVPRTSYLELSSYLENSSYLSPLTSHLSPLIYHTHARDNRWYSATLDTPCVPVPNG